ncbi:MAG: GGDEF domain-containing protein [Desulfobacteraceae bacterium]|jgi:GGDEF domain-containing protein
MESQTAEQYQEILTRQIGPDYASLPARYTFDHQPDYIKDLTHPDNLCGLPIYTPKLRHHLLTLCTTAIRREQNFAILKIDSDQLKLANETFGRLFGDETIRRSASLVSRQFENWPDDSQVFITRSTTGGDELYIFAINVQPEHLDQIQNISSLINNYSEQVSIPTPSGDQTYKLSSSAGKVTSAEHQFSREIDRTRELLDSGQIPYAFNLIQDMINKADDRAGSIKVLHELSSLPVNELMAMHPIQLKERISRQFGGGRISQAGLNILSMIEQISVHNWLRNPHSADATDGTDESAAGTENTTLRQIVDSYNSCFKPKQTS